jgi:hypothetical protein
MKQATKYRGEIFRRSGAKMILALILVLSTLSVTSCRGQAPHWPARMNRSPEEMLVDVIRWQQHMEVKESIGELDFQCFTDSDLKAFMARDRPRIVADLLRSAPDFSEIVQALRSLPSAERVSAFETARVIARPTWETMGFVDPQGRGQTEAGHRADLMLAAAITNAFESETAKQRLAT